MKIERLNKFCVCNIGRLKLEDCIITAHAILVFITILTSDFGLLLILYGPISNLKFLSFSQLDSWFIIFGMSGH